MGDGMGLISIPSTLAPASRKRWTAARPIPEEEPILIDPQSSCIDGTCDGQTCDDNHFPLQLRE